MGPQPDGAAVTLTAATREDAPLLSNLLGLYMHDLSGIFPVEIGADGVFRYEKLPLYWSEPATRFPFLILRGGRPAGCALVTLGSPASDDPEAFDVAEFFVLRGHRRAGVGRQAAFLLWDRLPGRWIVRVSEGNSGGLPFWQATVAEYTGGAFSCSRRPGSAQDWQVFAFASRRNG